MQTGFLSQTTPSVHERPGALVTALLLALEHMLEGLHNAGALADEQQEGVPVDMLNHVEAGLAAAMPVFRAGSGASGCRFTPTFFGELRSQLHRSLKPRAQ